MGDLSSFVSVPLVLGAGGGRRVVPWMKVLGLYLHEGYEHKSVQDSSVADRNSLNPDPDILC